MDRMIGNIIWEGHSSRTKINRKNIIYAVLCLPVVIMLSLYLISKGGDTVVYFVFLPVLIFIIMVILNEIFIKKLKHKRIKYLITDMGAFILSGREVIKRMYYEEMKGVLLELNEKGIGSILFQRQDFPRSLSFSANIKFEGISDAIKVYNAAKSVYNSNQMGRGR